MVKLPLLVMLLLIVEVSIVRFPLFVSWPVIVEFCIVRFPLFVFAFVMFVSFNVYVPLYVDMYGVILLVSFIVICPLPLITVFSLNTTSSQIVKLP